MLIRAFGLFWRADSKPTWRDGNLIAPEASEGLHVFGEDAQNTPIRTVYEGFVFVRQRRRFEFTFTHDELVFPSVLSCLVVVNRFPKTDPDVEYAQAGAQPAHKTICHDLP